MLQYTSSPACAPTRVLQAHLHVLELLCGQPGLWCSCRECLPPRNANRTALQVTAGTAQPGSKLMPHSTAPRAILPWKVRVPSVPGSWASALNSCAAACVSCISRQVHGLCGVPWRDADVLQLHHPLPRHVCSQQAASGCKHLTAALQNRGSSSSSSQQLAQVMSAQAACVGSQNFGEAYLNGRPAGMLLAAATASSSYCTHKWCCTFHAHDFMLLHAALQVLKGMQQQLSSSSIRPSS